MYNKEIVFFISISMLFSAFFFGCNDKESSIGIELLPDAYKISTSASDTLSVSAYTYRVDTMYTNNVSKLILGSYIDPIFGETNASFVTQVIATTNSVYYDTVTAVSAVPDSLILYLHYDNSSQKFYGDSTSVNSFQILKITKNINTPQNYNYDYNILDLSPEYDTTCTFVPKAITDSAAAFVEREYQAALAKAENATDSANVKKNAPVAILKVKLSNTLCKEFHEKLKMAKTNTFATLFNGLWVLPTSPTQNGAISRFEQSSSSTKVSLYYHKTSKPDSAYRYDFSLNTANHFNIYDHNYNAPGFLADLSKVENKRQDTVVYIQGLGGMVSKIKFPEIDILKQQGNWAVNRANLIVPLADSIVFKKAEYPAPDKLILLRINDDEKYDPLYEYDGSSGYIGVSLVDNSFVYDITYYIQQLFLDKVSNNGLVLQLNDGYVNPSRIVLNSGNNKSNPMRLELTLTKISK